MNAIAYSLYGRNPKYCIGAIKNVHLAARLYPGWKVFIYTDWTVPSEVVSKLKQLGATVIHVAESNWAGFFWRFQISDAHDVERFIIRDADSRINEREVAAVNAWITSGKSFHLMRDHPHHDTPVSGGLWGAVKGAIQNMGVAITKWGGSMAGYDSDQAFLRESIWPVVKNSCLQHDSCNAHKYPGSVPFPTRLAYNNPRFCGEVFDAQDNPRQYDWEKMLNCIRLGA